MNDREMVMQHFQDAIEASGNNNKWRFVRLDIIEKAIALLKEQEDCIRILTSDLEDLQKEHAKLLDKKIPLITNGQEVVRCRDCRYGEPATNGASDDCIQCNNDDLWLDGSLNFPDWFCADGERREECE